MKISQAFGMAFSSLRSNLMRAFLTMLGMIIGVGAVIAMISLMDGMIAYTTDQFQDMGTDLLTVNITGYGSKKVTEQQFYDFINEHPEQFGDMSPYYNMNVSVRSKQELEKKSSVIGVSEGYANMNSFEVEKGRFLAYADIVNRSRVCVIGSYTADHYFGETEPLGATLRLGTDTFQVVGVLKEKVDSTENSLDDCIFAPYSVIGRKMGMSSPSMLYIQMKDPDHSKDAQNLVEDYLYSIFHDTDCYMITNMAQLLDMMQDMTGVMQKILVGIAGISLLVAGIGIMNIMLVSVSERTREIGIRKSLGAKKKDIMRQFVIEAGTLSTIGGGIGILLGGLATTLLGNLIGMNCAPSTRAIILSFGVSAGIGLLFGYMPANKAAKLNPIDALRSE